ncbi:CSEP0359 putative effector protein [Blumeria hordei DH14]|uniref:CSEP0359 putative effector protein n=1 Tax=Blumeria graminis f. sp. hordei (strain DH14) TaxID=546991 RepID=N1JEX4_BLUG1|nr:CSEP0359 putative effector protein [Blumeria hordei DH14]
MKYFSIAAVALSVVTSASLHITDEGEIFQNGVRRPILNSNFRMSCLENTFYNENQILDFAQKAYRIIENSKSRLDRCTFDPFPKEVLYIYHIGKSQTQATGQISHYMIINFVGQFFAGFYQYQGNEGQVTKLCEFDEGTTFIFPGTLDDSAHSAK